MKNRASKPRMDELMGRTAAANADELGTERQAAEDSNDQDLTATGGWDAYEVWRRFIKEARARRQLES